MTFWAWFFTLSAVFIAGSFAGFALGVWLGCRTSVPQNWIGETPHHVRITQRPYNWKDEEQ